jgi:hypothetical protein
MSELTSFIQLGLRHILDVDAMDHILFLLALAAIYRPRDARKAISVITAFTIGHSITLGLAVTNVVRLPGAIIEFLIPVTIVVTAIENLVAIARRTQTRRRWYRAGLAGAFGLVHGAGFANYLNALFVDRVALPLFGFNVGIELGQIVVLTAAAVLLTALDSLIAAWRLQSARWPALHVRVAMISLVVMVVGSSWAIQRRPW